MVDAESAREVLMLLAGSRREDDDGEITRPRATAHVLLRVRGPDRPGPSYRLVLSLVVEGTFAGPNAIVDAIVAFHQARKA